MKVAIQRFFYGDPVEQRELAIWCTIDELHRLLAEAELAGEAFKPAARTAREALRAIGRR